jgi:hypothetical protein
MDLNSYITTRNAFFLTPVIFFWFVLICAVWICAQLLLPYNFWYPASHAISVAGYIIPYFISFCGSIILLNSFFKNWCSRMYLVPFIILTATGILLCLFDLFFTGTSDEWPLVPVAGLLLKLNLLLLTPAITLLLAPFVDEMKKPDNIIFTCLQVFSCILLIPIIAILIDDISPLFVPGFVWTKFWDFNITAMWVEVSFGLYIVFGMIVVGLLSVSIIYKYIKFSSVIAGDG